MRIVVLKGSPNKNGSSNLLAAEFIRGTEEAGHRVRVVDAPMQMYILVPDAFIADMKVPAHRRMTSRKSVRQFWIRDACYDTAVEISPIGL